jgi:aminoglycoside/choline kinase family phosphotransferase
MTELLHRRGVLPLESAVISVALEELPFNRGLSGDMCRLRIVYQGVADQAPATLIMKRTRARKSLAQEISAVFAQHSREALFYSQLADALRTLARLPKVYYAAPDVHTQSGVILLEDLGDCVGVNMFLGNQIWGVKPLARPREPAAVLDDMFSMAADLHAAHWNDPSLLRQPWLKAVAWYRGRDRLGWELSMEAARCSWRRVKAAMDLAPASGTSVAWSPQLVQVMDESLRRASWSQLRRRLCDRRVPFTLTHGDFHASNMLWRHGARTADRGTLLVVDWSEVGLWEPMADLGQTMISDVQPAVRRPCERALVQSYWERLVLRGVSADEYPLAQCWSEYERAGVERWIWVFAILSGMALPTAAVQYFHDQLLAFIQDHGNHPWYELTAVVRMLPT